MMLREQNIFSVSDVEYAVFETNGQLSVMKKPAVSSATKQDVKATYYTSTIYPNTSH